MRQGLRRPLSEIRERGYAGGETRVKQFVRGLVPTVASEAVVRFQTELGYQMQANWASVGCVSDKLKLFIATPRRSRSANLFLPPALAARIT